MAETERLFKSQLLGTEGRFAPNADLEDKNNYSRHLFIERDGEVTEVVRLNVWSDRHREDIIGFHFAQQHAKIHYGEQIEQPQFYVVGRDSPWDFEYVMHDGTTFFLEVCRVADKNLLKAIKIENDVSSLLLRSELKGFEIEKIEKHFPGTLPKAVSAQVKTKADRHKTYTLDVRSRLIVGPLLEELRLPLVPALEGVVRRPALQDGLWSSPGLMDTFSMMKESVFHAENEEPVPCGVQGSDGRAGAHWAQC